MTPTARYELGSPDPNPTGGYCAGCKPKVSRAAAATAPIAKVEDMLAPIPLNLATEAAYCAYARAVRHNEIWWYFNGLARFSGFSKPFADSTGRWWYCVKPGFAWPVNFFSPLASSATGFWRRPLLGWQFPSESNANSTVWMNVVHDLAGFEISRVHADKRRAVRKGIKGLDLIALDPADRAVAAEACDVWNSHVERTSWNTPMSVDGFAATWRELREWPGTTVIGARDRESGQLCSWVIARVIDDAVYVDTLASHTERLDNRPNDAIVFATLFSAASQGATKAHYSLRSSNESLERFKTSMGFSCHAFPAHLSLRWPVGNLLSTLKPHLYQRLRGELNWTQTAVAAEES